MTTEEKEDFAFLLDRVTRAGTIEFNTERETGLSSNSIVSIAYDIIPLESQIMPIDLSDLIACRNTWKKLPKHRRFGNALIALERAETEIFVNRQ